MSKDHQLKLESWPLLELKEIATIHRNSIDRNSKSYTLFLCRSPLITRATADELDYMFDLFGQEWQIPSATNAVAIPVEHSDKLCMFEWSSIPYNDMFHSIALPACTASCTDELKSLQIHGRRELFRAEVLRMHEYTP